MREILDQHERGIQYLIREEEQRECVIHVAFALTRGTPVDP